MKTLAAITTAALLSGCSTYYVGVGAHTTGLDRPEASLENPLGYFGGRKDLGHNFTGRCEHTSGILDYEDGYGMNECGVQYEW